VPIAEEPTEAGDIEPQVIGRDEAEEPGVAEG
jgi:hypothetical protein